MDLGADLTVGSSIGRLLRRRFSHHPERYLEIVRVLRRHHVHHVVGQLALGHRHGDDDGELALDQPHGDGGHDHAVGLARALEELGPCFIKLGQLLSTRPDLLPAGYADALTRLQDTVAPVPAEAVIAIVERELGGPMSEHFATFDERPLATASMAQVHRATLRDGAEVAVKVQRPGVRSRVEIDVEVLGELAGLATRLSPRRAPQGLAQTVRELEQSLAQELDFRVEADNTRLIGRQLAGFPRLTTPTVHEALTSRRVLTLSFVHGQPLAATPAERLREVDSAAIAKDLLSAYLKQMAIDGVFHCDPHPGNILLADDGRLALLDFGMVARLDAGQKDNVISLLLAFSERQGRRVADTYLEMVAIPRALDRRGFTQDISSLVSRYHDMSGARMALGTALLDLTRVARAHRAPVPSALTLLGKAMLNLDGTVRVLSPELDPVQLIRDYMLEVMRTRVEAQLSPGRLFAVTLDLKHLLENAPRHADAVLDRLANDQLVLRLRLDQLDEARLGLRRAATLLSASMVASALILVAGYLTGSRPPPPAPHGARARRRGWLPGAARGR